jgi:uncharacterized membrane protein
MTRPITKSTTKPATKPLTKKVSNSVTGQAAKSHVNLSGPADTQNVVENGQNGHSLLKFMGHPVHPLLTHFPMALLSITLLWDIMGISFKNSLWWNFSFWSLVVGLILAVPVLITGLLDSVTIAKDSPEEKTMMFHMYIMLCAAALYLGDLLARLGHIVPTSSGQLVLVLSLSVISFLTLVVGGWYGGELVYKHGVGRA